MCTGSRLSKCPRLPRLGWVFLQDPLWFMGRRILSILRNWRLGLGCFFVWIRRRLRGGCQRGRFEIFRLLRRGWRKRKWVRERGRKLFLKKFKKSSRKIKKKNWIKEMKKIWKKKKRWKIKNLEILEMMKKVWISFKRGRKFPKKSRRRLRRF